MAVAATFSVPHLHLHLELRWQLPGPPQPIHSPVSLHIFPFVSSSSSYVLRLSSVKLSRRASKIVRQNSEYIYERHTTRCTRVSFLVTAKFYIYDLVSDLRIGQVLLFLGRVEHNRIPTKAICLKRRKLLCDSKYPMCKRVMMVTIIP